MYFPTIWAYLVVGKEAGEIYQKSASCYDKANELTDACSMYQNAASCLRRDDPNTAIECYNSALTIMLRNGRFSSAAKIQKEIGEIYEKDMMNYPAAVDMYLEAGERFLGEDSRATASDCIMRAAKISCETSNTPRTLELFQKLVEISRTSDYAQFVMKEYLFGVSLCLLVMRNPNQAGQEIEKLSSQFPSFIGEREFESLEQLKNALTTQDIEAFQEAAKGIDFYSKLDSPNNKWKSSLLLRIRSKIQEEPSLA